MLISTKGRYALRILVDMAEHQIDGYMTLKEVAQRQDISEKYLEAIVKELVKNQILTGVRGKGGGYRLRRPPEQINAGEVLNIMEGTLAPVACLEAGTPPCARSRVPDAGILARAGRGDPRLYAAIHDCRPHAEGGRRE